MSVSNLTEGSWTAEKSGRSYVLTNKDKDFDVAMVRVMRELETKGIISLIAAAPDLYEALDQLLFSLTDEDGLLEHVKPVMDARAALAKARGEK